MAEAKWSKENSLVHAEAENVSADVGRAHVSAELGASESGVKSEFNAGYEVASGTIGTATGQSLSASVGPNVKTGGEIGRDGVSASFLGFGFSVGRNTGINTPLGSINLKFW